MAQLQRNRELSLLHLLYFRPTNARCTALDESLDSGDYSLTVFAISDAKPRVWRAQDLYLGLFPAHQCADDRGDKELGLFILALGFKKLDKLPFELLKYKRLETHRFKETTSSPLSGCTIPAASVYFAAVPFRSIRVSSTTSRRNPPSPSRHTPRATLPKSESVLRRTNPTIA